MISSLSSTSSSLFTSSLSSTSLSSSSSSSSSLTDAQKKELEEILSKYDSSNMTADSTKSLMDELKSSGIKPGKEVKDLIASEGFDIKSPQGPPPSDGVDPTSSTSSSSSTSDTSSTSSTSSSSSASSSKTLPAYLQDFVDKEEAGTVTQDDIKSLISSLQSAGQSTTGVLVDQTS